MLQKIITLIFLSGDPLPLKTIASLVPCTEDEIKATIPNIESSLSVIGLTLLVSDEGLSIVTQSAYADLVAAFWKEELKGDLTPASLQVLTLVAYLGSPSREDISYIRGVQSSQSIRTLTVRGLISRSGEICTLTGDALKQLGITKVEELPEYSTLNKQFSEKLIERLS